MDLSKIAKKIPASPIRNLVPYANRAKKRGIKVYQLNIGDPDIKTPQVMIDVLKNWTVNPIGYSDSQGDHIFIDSLLKYYASLGFSQLSEKNIQVTVGGSEGLLWTFLSVGNPGEEILAFEPLYANYLSYAIMANLTIVPILTSIEDGFHLPSKEEIESKISKKTRAILIGSPGNPTGVVYTKREMDMLVDLCEKYNLYLISDEVYREFVYDGGRAISALSYLDRIPEKIIVVDSLSKRYSLCGARVGVLVSKNSLLMESFLRYGQARLSAGLIDQIVASQLTKISNGYFTSIVKEYKTRRDTLVSALKKIPGVVCPTPEGAFYIIIKLPVADAEDFAKFLLSDFDDKKETVMLAPATGFYQTTRLGKSEVRIAYVLKSEDLVRSAEILEKALKVYNKK